MLQSETRTPAHRREGGERETGDETQSKREEAER